MDVIDADNCKKIIKALEQEPCEECVSRKAVIDTIYVECDGTKLDIDFAKVLVLQRKIKALPSVTSQEPKIVPIAEIKFDEDKLKELVDKAVLTVTSQEPVIDKIKSIVAEWKMDTWTDNLSYECMIKIAEIIDKAESEE